MTRRLTPALHRQHLRAQAGAATLVIVMVLFLIMALLAAYANRSLLFEQRIATSYYRASIAQEAAEAGIEWTLAQLNGAAVNASCAPVATGGTRFVDRYLSISPDDRNLRRAVTGNVADCKKNGTGWSCRCPTAGAWTATTAGTDTAISASFAVQFQQVTSTTDRNRGGTVRVQVRGCTNSSISNCDTTDNNSRSGQGTNLQDATIALVSAVRSPPAAPLVAKGSLTASGSGGLGLRNSDPRSAGLLYQVGGSASGLNDTRMTSVPGTAPAQAQIAGDTSLTTDPADPTRTVDVFRMFMGSTPARYRNHPSLREVACTGDCAADLAAAYAAGKRVMWVSGDLSIDSSLSLGTLSDPVVVIADGSVSISGTLQFVGMLVARGNVTWTNSAGTSQLSGMLLAEGNVNTTGAMDIVYLPAIADQLRNRVGSFVRVPGGWTDLR